MAKSKASATSSIYSATKELDASIRAMLLAGVYQMRTAAGELANLGRLAILVSISQSGSYKKYLKKGKERMSSQPGRPPAAEKGEDLEPSIYSKVNTKFNQNPAIAEFGSTASFAKTLEFGNAKLPARPFVRPARQKIASVAEPIIIRNLIYAYNRNNKKRAGGNLRVDMEM